MAIDTENPFEADVTGLDVVGVQPGAFDKALQLEQQQKMAELTNPQIETDVPEMELPTEAQIAVKRDPLELQTFDLLGRVEDDASSTTDTLGFNVNTKGLAELPKFDNELGDYRADLTKRSTLKSIGVTGEEEEKAPIDEAEMPDFGLEPDLDALYDAGMRKAQEYGQQGYGYVRDLFIDPSPKIQTTGAYDVTQGGYRQPYSTGYLGTYPTQSSIGLSSAPPASLAGQGNVSMVPFATGTAAGLANLGVRAGTQTGLGTFSTMGASGNVPFPTGLGTDVTKTAAGSSAMKVFGQAASIYGIYDGIKNKDYFSAGTSLMTLLNPATAVPVAIMQAAKMLFGAWSASNRPKPKFGGAEFKAEKNRLTATGGYGYNGYQPSAGQATVASIADYVNTYVKTFGLQFNGSRWAKAIEADPRLNRYDTMNDSGYNDPSVLSRKIFETDGLITGTPTYNGQPITSQEDYKAKMEEFNEYYKKTALERGGLVDAEAVGINTPLSNEYDKITFKVSNQVGGGGTGKQYTTRTTGGGRGGSGGTTQTGYWQTTGGGGRGGGNRVWVPAAPNVVVQSGGRGTGGSDAYAISYRYEDATPYDMLYRNLVGNFNRGQGGTYY